jgi:hypothetical protein
VGASVEGELNLVMDAIVLYPIQCMFTLCHIYFFFQENSWRTLSWRGDQWLQCYPQAFHGNEKVGS